MLTELTTKIIRRCLVGKHQDFSFTAPGRIDVPPVAQADLYVHIPFCKNMCPYCPYNKVKYDQGLARPYLRALLAEIDLYYRRLGRIEISSIYIGGGTPTTMIDELEIILDRIRERFRVTGSICIEINPGEIGREAASRLVACGVDLVSLGVQSFNDRYLSLLGRSYRASILDRAIDRVLSAGFTSVNLDMMFALPGQSLREVMQDMHRAAGTGADQVTAYPLFSFPYTAAGRYRKLKKVKMPRLPARRAMYRAIHEFFCRQGFRRVSVWGFVRGEAPRYSSVTRDRYIGLGAGAASHLPGKFYFNTFSVDGYIKRCLDGVLPVALNMDITRDLSLYYWLYWRLYDTYIPKRKLFELFGEENRKMNLLLKLLGLLRLAEESEDTIALNERGAFWLHLAQNYFVLNYINKVWSAARETPFPEKINI